MYDALKLEHEVRDPIYGFIRFTNDEKKLIATPFFQRLRYIRQLGTTFMIYPSAQHSRFEHSLGVMELATRIYVTIIQKAEKEMNRRLPTEAEKKDSLRLLRYAALCHDMGHLPFSHSAEKIAGRKKHENLSLLVIREKLAGLWKILGLTEEQVTKIAKYALGPEKWPGDMNDWEILVSDIITGDVFGADRMDYLLRDSLHLGVAYGRFDHHRLVDCLRIIQLENNKLELGIEEGGLRVAESLLMARYFMYAQVYLHDIRVVYDIHLTDFMREWLTRKGKRGKSLMDSLLTLTDDEVLVAMRKAKRSRDKRLRALAARFVDRQHFRCVYSLSPADCKWEGEEPLPPDSVVNRIHESLAQEFRKDAVRSLWEVEDIVTSFLILKENGSVSGAVDESELLRTLQGKPLKVGYVFLAPEYCDAQDKRQKVNEIIKSTIASIADE